MMNNKGYQVENWMKKWFKGESHPLDCVDFKTKTTLYECKSCAMLHTASNGNSRRDYAKTKHQDIYSHKLGRFYIDRHNHVQLKVTAEEEGKVAKYIFVMTVGTQKVWRTKTWNQINNLMQEQKTTTIVKIAQIFD